MAIVQRIYFIMEICEKGEEMEKINNENYFSEKISKIYTGSSEIKRIP